MELPLTQETFAALLHTKFNVEVNVADNETRQIELELTEVSALKVTPRQEQFAIVFRGPDDMLLPQATHLLVNEEVGRAELFLVPFAQNAEGFFYEAVFNRMRDKSEANTSQA